MNINAAPGSVNTMIQGMIDAAKLASGGSLGVHRKGKDDFRISIGSPFDPFNGLPPEMMAPAGEYGGGYDAGGGTDYGGLPGATAEPTPRQRILAKPRSARLMGSPGGGRLAGLQRNQMRGPGSVPFGGVFANGGIAPAGRASLVGEEGPELIIPSGPTRVVPMRAPAELMQRSPMAAVPSGKNHSYDHGLGFGPGLAGRPTRQVGRSGYDLNRIAEREYRQRKDPRMLISMDWRNRMGGQAPAELMPPQAGVAMQPQGHWTPGFNGSQVFIKDTAPPEMTPRTSAPPTLDAETGAMINEAPVEMQPPQARMPFEGVSLPGMSAAWKADPVNNMLPPSTLGGAPGTPPPPRVTRMDIAGADGKPLGWVGYDTQTGKGVGLSGAYPHASPPIEMMPAAPGMNLFVPQQGGERVPGLPNFKQEMVPGSLVKRVTEGRAAPRQFTPVPKAEKPNIQWQDGTPYHISTDEQGNPVVRKLKIIDENGDNIDDRLQGGGGAAPAAPGWKSLLPQASSMNFKIKTPTGIAGARA